MNNQNTIRTDLALEAHEMFREQNLNNNYPQGIEVEEFSEKGMKTTRVKVISENGVRAINKPLGNYITIEAVGLRVNDKDLYEDASRRLSEELKLLINSNKQETILVVGLGNWNITPDSLGPKVVSKVLVSRHLINYMPEQIDERLTPVCAVSPGVLGITGIETVEIVRGIVDKVNPSLIIAIDSLASRKIERVNTTIQISDTGIAPGSGVGNNRMELSRNTLGRKVIAIGVPTVIDASTMTHDTIETVLKSLGSNSNYPNRIDRNQIDNSTVMKEILGEDSQGLIVTPKEIDEVMDKVSKIIANGINIAVHEGITQNDVDRYI